MNRRDFAVKSSLFFATSVVGIGTINGCSEYEEEKISDYGDFLKSGNPESDLEEKRVRFLKEMITKSYDLGFLKYKNSFRQKRVILIISNYQIIKLKENVKKIDYILRLSLVGMLKFNFDFYNSDFNTGVLIAKKGSKLFISNDFSKKIQLFEMDNKKKEIDFPIRFNSHNQGVELNEFCKLPCIMRKNDFKKIVRNQGMIRLIENLN